MLSSTNISKWFSVIIFICATTVATQNLNITIPLSKTTVSNDKQLYGDFVTLNRSSKLQVKFNNIRNDLAFVIIQVHSHLHNITLYKNVEERDTSVTGTNLGLHSGTNSMASDTFYVKNSNVDVDLKLYVAVHGYLDTDPIPGGCYTELPIISPFMTAIYNRDYIYVDAVSAQFRDPRCILSNPLNIEITFYMLYLPEKNYDSDVYFEGIIDMMSLKNIKKKRIIPHTGDARFQYMRRILTAYPGTGAVYVAVARHISEGLPSGSMYSVYVPVTSYGCSPAVYNDCEMLDDYLSQFACALLFFIGLFICYFGHRFFKCHMFLIGFLSGLVVTTIVASLIKKDLDNAAILAISSFSGLCIGASRLVYWWIYGLPVFSIILSSADVGFLVASLVFYAVSDQWAESLYLNLDINFWSIFVVIITLITIFLLIINRIANFICCAVIGAYATILPIDYYIGSHMKYILINVLRRATVERFNKAAKMATFQWKDWILTFLWIGLSVTGFWYQYHHNKGRPPFPPPPRSVRARSELPALMAGPNRYRRSLNNEDGFRALPHYFNEKTPLLA